MTRRDTPNPDAPRHIVGQPLPRRRDGSIVPPPTYADRRARELRDTSTKKLLRMTSADRARLRRSLNRFGEKHGADALIAFLKLELEKHGEERWRLDQLAPHPGDANGQTSILDAGR